MSLLIEIFVKIKFSENHSAGVITYDYSKVLYKDNLMFFLKQ